MPTFELPEKYKSLYIHRKNKDLIEAETALDKETGKVINSIYRNNNGITAELLTDEIFAKELLPLPTDNVLRDSIALGKYLRKNGYKVVTKIAQTKNGVRFG